MNMNLVTIVLPLAIDLLLVCLGCNSLLYSSYCLHILCVTFSDHLAGNFNLVDLVTPDDSDLVHKHAFLSKSSQKQILPKNKFQVRLLNGLRLKHHFH